MAKPCQADGDPGPLAERIDAHLEDSVNRGFSGAVLVEQQGEILLCQGYGWTDSTRLHPITPRTLFFIASITKQFTAAGILLLEEDGTIGLSDSLGRFFPTLTGSASRVTLHQLLTHSAGLTQNYMMDGIVERDSAVAAVFRDFPEDPVHDFNYTNDAYGVLAAVIEVVSGEPYESFVRRRLLEPSGMGGTTFWGQADDLDATRFAQKASERPEEMRSPNWGYRGAAGIWSTLEDLYSWYRTAWRGPLLSEESRRRMFQAHVHLPSGTGIGYGSFTSPAPRGTVELWARGTEDFGHNAVIRWFPEEGTLVILVSNAGEIDGTPANQQIGNEIVDILFEQDRR
ncbi:MAG: serine hydrolase domain-containing protein [Gemmatimonadota bacterium]